MPISILELVAVLVALPSGFLERYLTYLHESRLRDEKKWLSGLSWALLIIGCSRSIFCTCLFKQVARVVFVQATSFDFIQKNVSIDCRRNPFRKCRDAICRILCFSSRPWESGISFVSLSFLHPRPKTWFRVSKSCSLWVSWLLHCRAKPGLIIIWSIGIKWAGVVMFS